MWTPVQMANSNISDLYAAPSGPANSNSEALKIYLSLITRYLKRDKLSLTLPEPQPVGLRFKLIPYGTGSVFAPGTDRESYAPEPIAWYDARGRLFDDFLPRSDIPDDPLPIRVYRMNGSDAPTAGTFDRGDQESLQSRFSDIRMIAYGGPVLPPKEEGFGLGVVWSAKTIAVTNFGRIVEWSSDLSGSTSSRKSYISLFRVGTTTSVRFESVTSDGTTSAIESSSGFLIDDGSWHVYCVVWDRFPASYGYDPTRGFMSLYRDGTLYDASTLPETGSAPQSVTTNHTILFSSPFLGEERSRLEWRSIGWFWVPMLGFRGSSTRKGESAAMRTAAVRGKLENVMCGLEILDFLIDAPSEVPSDNGTWLQPIVQSGDAGSKFDSVNNWYDIVGKRNNGANGCALARSRHGQRWTANFKMWLEGEADALWLVMHSLDGVPSSTKGLSSDGYSGKIDSSSFDRDMGLCVTFDIFNGRLVVSEKSSTLTTVAPNLSWPRKEWLQTVVTKLDKVLSIKIYRSDGTIWLNKLLNLTQPFDGKQKERFGFQARTGAATGIFRVKEIKMECSRS